MKRKTEEGGGERQGRKKMKKEKMRERETSKQILL